MLSEKTMNGRWTTAAAGICLWMATVATATAGPANPNARRVIETADGRQVTVSLMGDEYGYYWKAVDGGDCYAKGEDGSYARVNPESVMEQARSRRKAVQASGEGVRRSVSPLGYPCTTKQLQGKKRIPTLLVEYADVKFSTPDLVATFDKILNGENYHEGRFKGSVRDYFLSQSNGRLDLTFDVKGPFLVSKDMAYYCEDNSQRIDVNMSELVSEAATSAAPQFDYSQYDWDGDDVVDQVLVICAGVSQSSGGDSYNLWPHRSAAYAQIGNMRIWDYACSTELDRVGDSQTRLSSIGTICHELSHCFGLPDTYDQTTGNYGTQKWDVMGLGVHNDDGFTPAGYTAFNKLFCLWQEPVVLSDDTTVGDMRPMADGGDFYLIPNDAWTDEFYLLENRQQEGWDAGLPGHGMLVMHVDYDKDVFAGAAVNQSRNGNDHERCGLVLADNNTSLASTYKEWIADYQGDLYPWQSNNRLTDTSTPATRLFHANIDGEMLLGKPVTNIAEHSDGTMSFTFTNNVAKKEILTLKASDGTIRFVSDTEAQLKLNIKNVGYHSYSRKVGAYVWTMVDGVWKLVDGANDIQVVNLAPGEETTCLFSLAGLADNTDYAVMVYYYRDNTTTTWSSMDAQYNFNMADRNKYVLTTRDDAKVTVLSENAAQLDVTIHNESYLPYTNTVDCYTYTLVNNSYESQPQHASVGKEIPSYSDAKFTFRLEGLVKNVVYHLFLYYHQSDGSWVQLSGPHLLTITDSNIGLRGDLNGDGQVDVGDIMAIINYMANPTATVPGDSSSVSSPFDLNGDGQVDVGDIMAIINIMAK